MIVALKSIFSYVYLIVLLRVLGKKEYSQLTMHDFVVFLLIADLMVMGFNGDIIDSVIATLVLVVVDYVSNIISLKSKQMRDFIEGTPSMIIFNGKLNIKEMKRCKYTCDSLAQHLRQNGISSISEVAFACLENNGQLSVVSKKENNVKQIIPVIMDGEVNTDALYCVGYDEMWLVKNLKGYQISDIMYAVIEKERLFFISK